MIIVRESLNEFKRGQDPKKALQIGGELKKIQKWLRPFLFVNQYHVNSDWEIDIVKGDFIAYEDNIPELPEYIQFGECVGAFVMDAKGLTTMRGCPRIVHGDFYVGHNELQFLDGSPEYVGGSYSIRENPVKFSVADIEQICDVKGQISV